jgi:hypothetical protein
LGIDFDEGQEEIAVLICSFEPEERVVLVAQLRLNSRDIKPILNSIRRWLLLDRDNSASILGFAHACVQMRDTNTLLTIECSGYLLKFSERFGIPLFLFVTKGQVDPGINALGVISEDGLEFRYSLIVASSIIEQASDIELDYQRSRSQLKGQSDFANRLIVTTFIRQEFRIANMRNGVAVIELDGLLVLHSSSAPAQSHSK